MSTPVPHVARHTAKSNVLVPTEETEGQVKTHTFCGRKYHIMTEVLDGWTDQQDDDQQWLLIMRPLDTRAGLETAIHEALHACDWKAKENEVTDVARDIARFLWRLGWRHNAT